MPEPLTLYKLMILYLLYGVSFPLTGAHISEFILGRGYTTYFKLQQAFCELSEAGLIEERPSRRRTFYYLTQDGAEALKFFKKEIPPAIREEIKRFLAKKKYDFKTETEVAADFYQKDSGEYAVRCRISENRLPLIELTLSVPSKDEAERVASNWTDKNEKLYSLIMSALLS